MKIKIGCLITLVLVLFANFTSGTKSDSLTAQMEPDQLKALMAQGVPIKKILALNPIAIVRDQETISLPWEELNKNVTGLTKENVGVFDIKANNLLVTQIVSDGKNSQLLSQANFGPREEKNFLLIKLQSWLHVPVSPKTTYCRFVPERKDDFAWENDKVAFRMYGPALESETITCGIDAWGKCVSYPVIDKFYKEANYHANYGEGGDFYTVGNTLGCGGSAPFVNGKIILPRNFKSWKIITDGPIRSEFELTYAPWKAGGRTVSETKRISIDLGSNLNRVECAYKADKKPISIAAGIILQKTSNEKITDSKNMIGYWLPADGNNGMMGCGVLFGKNIQAEMTESDNHLLMVADQPVNKPLIYFAGSCWNANKDFKTIQQWKEYLINFKQRIDNPVIVKFSN